MYIEGRERRWSWLGFFFGLCVIAPLSTWLCRAIVSTDFFSLPGDRVVSIVCVIVMALLLLLVFSIPETKASKLDRKRSASLAAYRQAHPSSTESSKSSCPRGYGVDVSQGDDWSFHQEAKPVMINHDPIIIPSDDFKGYFFDKTAKEFHN